MKTRCATLAILLSLGSGCSSDPDGGGADASSPGQDASALDAATPGDGGSGGDGGAPRPVEVGTGRDSFEVLVEGQEVALSVGPQGGGRMMGYHVWMGLRARGVNPTGVRATYTILGATTRDLHAEQTRLFNLEPSGDAFVSYGIAPRIIDCCLVENQDVLLRVEITDADGVTAEDERRVHAGACLDRDQRRICP